MIMLAERGHESVVVCREHFAKHELSGARSRLNLSNALTVDHGVKVYSLPGDINFEQSLDHVIGLWDPDCVLIGEDPTYLSLAVTLEKSVKRVVLLAQSQATLPFGPEAFYPDRVRAELLKPPVEIAVLSNYVREYIEQWGQLDSMLLPPMLKEQLGAPLLWHHENPFIMFVNAAGIKGLPVFVQLAQRFPSAEFAAVRGWATTSGDIDELHQHANITILEPKENIDEILSRAKLLLAPSLWGEALGYIALEAMARGIPVLASNVGGLPEAKLGVDYLLPVNPVRGYSKTLDERLLPEPIIPEQNLEPWCDALRLLLKDRAHYNQLSMESRSVAMKYLEELDENLWMDYLESC